MRYYRLWDSETVKEPGYDSGTQEIYLDEAEHWNDKKYGIFQVVNDFEGKDRRDVNAVGANYWFIDLDKGSKIEQAAKIRKGLPPSWVIESKNGFHVYWRTNWKDGLDNLRNTFPDIVKRLVKFYDSDVKAKNILRLLRLPDFKHWKDSDDPFMVKEVHKEKSSHCYTISQMQSFYPPLEVKKHKPREQKAQGNEFFDKLDSLNQMDLLAQLSGSPYVGNESYNFKKSSGGYNVYVNDKSTSCWIDKDGFIGSADRGGPTIWQWLKWFNHNDKEIYRIIKEEFHNVGL